MKATIRLANRLRRLSERVGQQARRAWDAQSRCRRSNGNILRGPPFRKIPSTTWSPRTRRSGVIVFHLDKGTVPCYPKSMEEVIRNVRDLPTAERRAYERAVGHQLRENQQVILRVVTRTDENASASDAIVSDDRPAQTIEDWAKIYQGLSEEEVQEIDKIVNSRANLTRPTP